MARIIKSSLFACIGAGAGITLVLSLAMAASALWLNAIPFDCSTAQLCGLSFVNTLLGLLVYLGGTAMAVIVGAAIGSIYALPICLVLGCGLYLRALKNNQLDRRSVAYILGGIGGALWWLGLAELKLLPSTMANDYQSEATYGTSIMLILASFVGGIFSAEMFLRWLKTELIELSMGNRLLERT